MANKTKGKDPAVLFYTSDFLSGTYTMNYSQRGKYITLLCIQHQKGFLTKQELEYISEGEASVIEKFAELDGKYVNLKMYNETIRRKEYTENRLKNFHKKSLMNSHKDSLMETHTETETETGAVTVTTVIDNVTDNGSDTENGIDFDWMDNVVNR
jgi:hypothetical protein